MYIILVFVLIGSNGAVGFKDVQAVESVDGQKRLNNMQHLARCLLWAKTLPYTDRLEYLRSLRRIAVDFRDQQRDLFDSNRLEIDDKRTLKRVKPLKINHLIHKDNVVWLATPIFACVLVFFVSFSVLMTLFASMTTWANGRSTHDARVA